MLGAIDGGTVIVIAVLFAIPVALIFFITVGPDFRQIGKGPLSIDHPEPGDDRADEAQLREEVRQLVVASNERRERRGEAPLEVEQEVERKLAELAELR